MRASATNLKNALLGLRFELNLFMVGLLKIPKK